MIRYALKCENSHAFESWFQSAGAYDTLHGQGMVTCPTCGSGVVEKAIMAPSVSKTSDTPAPRPSLKPEPSDKDTMLDALRKHIETTSEYVGDSFASEARDIHEGNAPERAIHGEAKHEDARKLVEDGIDVTPLPFTSSRNRN